MVASVYSSLLYDDIPDPLEDGAPIVANTSDNEGPKSLDIPTILTGVEAIYLKNDDVLSAELMGRLLTPALREVVEDVTRAGGKVMLRGGTLTNVLYGGALLSESGELDPEARSDMDLVAMDAQTFKLLQSRLGITDAAEHPDSFFVRGHVGGIQVDVVSVPHVQEAYLKAAEWLQDWYSRLPEADRAVLEERHKMVMETTASSYSEEELFALSFNYGLHRMALEESYQPLSLSEKFNKAEGAFRGSILSYNDPVVSRSFGDQLKYISKKLYEDPTFAISASGLLPLDVLGVEFRIDPYSDALAGRINDPIGALEDPQTKSGLLRQTLMRQHFGVMYSRPDQDSLVEMYLESLPQLDLTQVDTRFLQVFTSNLFPRILRMEAEQNVGFAYTRTHPSTYAAQVLYPGAISLNHALYEGTLPANVEASFVKKTQLAMVRISLSEPSMLLDSIAVDYPFGAVMSPEFAAIFSGYHSNEKPKGATGSAFVILSDKFYNPTAPTPREAEREYIDTIYQLNLTEPQDWMSLRYLELCNIRFSKTTRLVEDVGGGTSEYVDFGRHPYGMSEVMALVFSATRLDPQKPNDLRIIESVVTNWKLSGKAPVGWVKDKTGLEEFDVGLDLEKIKGYMMELQDIPDSPLYAYTRDTWLVEGL